MNTEVQKKPNRIAMIILLVLLLVGIWLGLLWYLDFIHYVSTDDAAISGDHVLVSAKMMGRVLHLMADEGDKVTAGQLLVELDATDLHSQAIQSGAALNSAEQNLLLAKVNLDKAEQDFSRNKNLYDSGNVISKEEYDHTANTRDAAKAQYAIALSQIDTARAQLAVIQTQLQNTRIDAPLDGVVAKRLVMPGEVVQPGQAIFDLNDVKQVWVVANFEETKIDHIHPGEVAEITVDAYPNRTFFGRVVQVGADIIPPPLAIGDSTKTTQKVPIKVVFDRPDAMNLFVRGISVEVKVRIR